MFSFRSIFLSSLLGFAAAHATLFSVNSVWIVPGSGDWSINGNWFPAVYPDDPGDTATFPNINSEPAFISIPATLTQIQTLTIDSPQSYILVSSGGSVIPSPLLASQNGAFIINNTTGNASHTILAPVDLSQITAPSSLIITQNSTSPFTISGQITGPAGVGIVYNGPQTMILNGNNNSFASLNITAGTVQIGSQTALSGAVTNSGTLQLPAGPQNISSFTQNPSGTLAIDYTSPGSPSQLFMTGAADIGGTLSIATTAGAAYPTTPVTIIQANSIAGQFAKFTASGLFVPVLNYEPQTVSLTLIPMASSSQIKSLQVAPLMLLGGANQRTWMVQNQQVNLINRIQNNNAFAAPPGDDEGLENPPPPPPGGGIQFQDQTAMLTAYNELSTDPLNVSFMPYDKTRQYQQILANRIDQPETGYQGRLYVGPTATIGKAEGENYIKDGAQIGVDYAFTELGIGGLFFYDHYSAKGLTIDQITGTLYLTYVPKKMPQIAISGDFEYSYDWLLFHTKKGLKGDLHTAKGTPRGMEFKGLLAFQYFFDIGEFNRTRQGLRISPYVGLEYKQIDVDGFKEHGSGKFDTQAKKTTEQQLLSDLVLYLMYNKEWDTVSISPLVSVGYQGVLTQSLSNIHLKPAGSHDPFTTFKVKEPGRNYFIASVDLQVYFFKKYGVEASWDFEWNKLYYDSAFFLGFSLMF